MSHKRENRKLSLYLLGVMALIPLLIHVSPLHAESLDSMALRSDAVVIALPREKVSYWDGDIIRTRAVLDVKQVVSGALQKKTVTVVYDGGVVGEIGLKVSHGVRLPRDQKAILFLKKTGEHFSILNQRRGIYLIFPSQQGEIAVPAEAVHLPPPGLSVKSSRSTTWTGEGIPLNEFISTLQSFKR